MHENHRAADDVDTIHAAILDLQKARVPKRKGSQADHCSHCPQEPADTCNLNCLEQAQVQGWYTPETFGE